ncbi:hypothetical protein Ddye_001158 [Dipteronia dyeriana]|uniref:MULE transposase domain-containing protein n=1 Tax=Dipteronia dyeriana TaxID=168575 RepID=A0AAD9XN29_9ROSI|nr:hypothetical protein Ddye_001158 [Dipteronia dyeriana]
MYVSKNMTYEELMSIVQTVVKYNVNKYIVDLQSISIVLGTTCRTFIRNDNVGMPTVSTGFDRFWFLFGTAVDIAETSEVRPNVTEVDSDNDITWERFGGTMFVATAQYGNEQTYPIAFGYGDSKNNLSWEWFLDCLKGAIGHIDDLVFIYSYHASIEAGISKVFSYATHTICCWHFSENIKELHHRKDVAAIMDKAARVYTKLEYSRHMEELRNLHLNAYDYVNVVGLHK